MRSRYRDDQCIGQYVPPLIDQLLQFVRCRQVDFIDNEDCFNPAAEDLVHKFVPMFGTLGYVGDVKDDVSVLEGPLHHLHHRLVKLVIGFQDTRRIGIDDLEVVAVDDTQNPVARGLRLGSDNGKAFAHQRVHQRRFPHVGVADDVDKTRFMHNSPCFSESFLYSLFFRFVFPFAT